MRIHKSIVAMIVIAVIAAAGWILLKKEESIFVAEPAHKDIYYCPMHPHVISDKPGACPICQMKLVKKVNGAQPAQSMATSGVSEYSTVSINTQQQQLMGIRTMPVTKKTLTKTIHAYGYVAHDLELYDAQLEYVAAWRAFYPFLSRRTVAGEFRQDWRQYYMKSSTDNRWRSDDVVKAQQRVIKAESELTHMGLNETEIQQLREIKYGQPWVQPNLIFFDKHYEVFVYAEIPENDLGFISPSQKIVAQIPVYGETTQGVIRNIAPVVDPVTRTARARIELPDYRGELSVNLYVNIDIPVELDDALVVPRDAIMDTGLRKIVFVQAQEGVFEPRTIKTGFEGDGMVAVKSGIKEGETIVVSGNFLLDSESRLQGSLTEGQ